MRQGQVLASSSTDCWQISAQVFDIGEVLFRVIIATCAAVLPFFVKTIKEATLRSAFRTEAVFPIQNDKLSAYATLTSCEMNCMKEFTSTYSSKSIVLYIWIFIVLNKEFSYIYDHIVEVINVAKITLLGKYFSGYHDRNLSAYFFGAFL
jgi:hypothetical protein